MIDLSHPLRPLYATQAGSSQKPAAISFQAAFECNLRRLIWLIDSGGGLYAQLIAPGPA